MTLNNYQKALNEHKNNTLMKKLTLIFAFSLFGIGASYAMKPDTLRIYTIDKQRIHHFTGKQLVGKTIKQYDILYAIAPEDGKVVEKHYIKTTTPASPSITEATPHYLLHNGCNELTKEEFQNIKTDNIKAIEVLKAGFPAIKERGLKDDGRGYIIITLKK